MPENDTLTVFNNTPYHDDLLDKDQNGLTPLDKNYLRILFKPGHSVQTRELNQLQSLFQSQIDRLGKHLLHSNRPLLGGEVIFDPDLKFFDCRIDKVGTTEKTPLDGWIENGSLKDLEINQPGTTISAIITAVEDKGTAENNTDQKEYRLFIKYKSGDVSNTDLNTLEFYSESLILKYNPTNTTVFFTKIANSEGLAVAASMKPGFYFARGCAVQVDSQYAVHALAQGDRLTEELYSGFIVLEIEEKTVNSDDDKTLLDNAANTVNYAFVGADRYQINLKLKFAYDTTGNDNLLTVKIVRDSVIPLEVASSTDDSVKRGDAATRTSEESGDYVLKKPELIFQEVFNDGLGSLGKYNDPQDMVDASFYSRSTPYNNDISNDYAAAKAESLSDFAVTISPNVAYVKGYRTPLLEPYTLIVPKSRSLYSEKNNENYFDVSISANVGSYVTATVEGGLPNIDSYSTLYALFNDAASPQEDEQIGTCKIRTIESLGNNTVRIYLHNISMNSGRLFSEVAFISPTSIIGANYGDPYFTLTQPGELKDVEQSRSLYRWPVDTVNNVRNINVVEKVSDVVDVTNAGTGNIYAEFTTTNGFDKSPTNILAVYYDTDQSTYTVFNDFEVDTSTTSTSVLKLNLANSLTSGQLNAAGVSDGDAQNDKVRIIASAYVSYAPINNGVEQYGLKQRTTATITTANILSHNGVTEFQTGGVYEIPGVYHLISVEGENWQLFNDGQRDTEYVNATVKALASNPGDLTVTYWNFTSNQSYFVADSYLDENGNKVEIGEISKYDGVRLNEYLDLRTIPGQTDRLALDPYSTISADIDFYLGRRDLLVAKTNKEVSIITGEPDVYPKFPSLSDSSIAIAEITVPPYTFDVRNIRYSDVATKGYTMADIKTLDDRIKTLEYYTTLSLLERNAAEKDIYDETGLERFKNGFIVDSFTAHNVGNILDKEYSVSVSNVRGKLYPEFSPTSVTFGASLDSNPSLAPTTDYPYSGILPNTIQCRYKEVEFINQPYATQFINVQPHNVVAVNGVLSLFPEHDVSIDATHTPAVKDDAISSVFDDFANSIVELGNASTIVGKVWDPPILLSQSVDKKTSSSSKRTSQTTIHTTKTTTITTTSNFEQFGIETTAGLSDEEVLSLGRYVTELELIPYMRSRAIVIWARELLPGARFYPFFDDINVSDYCSNLDEATFITYTQTPETSIDREINGVDSEQALIERFPSSPLIADSEGKVRGIFIVPNSDSLRFFSGEKIFKLTTSPRNIPDEASSYAVTKFLSNGVSYTTEEKTIGVRTPGFYEEEIYRTFTTVDVNKKKKTTVRYVDPVAQSFRVDAESGAKNGVFVTSVDAYFATKPSTTAQGNSTTRNDSIRAYLIGMENGYPGGPRHIIDGTVSSLTPEEVNVSDDSSVATTFTFEHPVYLEPNREYAVCLFTQSSDYNVFVSDLGAQDLLGEGEVAGQPFVGVFFTSSNQTTWTADQNKDLKFKLNRADFDTSPASVNADPIIGQFIGSVDVLDGGVGYTTTGTTVTFDPPQEAGGSTATGTAIIDVDTDSIIGVQIDSPGSGYTSEPTVTVTHNPEISDPANRARLRANLKRVDVSMFSFNQKNITPGGDKTRITNRLLLDQSEYNVQPGQVIESLSQQNIYFDTNNSQNSSLRMTLKTDDSWITPQIERYSTFLDTRKYLITNDQNTTAKYITKRLILENPADQIDGWIAMNLPSNSADVKVYVKVFDASGSVIENPNPDATLTDGFEWWGISPVEPRTLPVNSNRNRYSEVRYTKNFESDNVEFSSIIIKIALLSDNIIDVPTCKDLRFIASS